MNSLPPVNGQESAKTDVVTSRYWYGVFMTVDLTRATECVSSFRFPVDAGQAKREMVEITPEFPIGAVHPVAETFRLPPHG